MTQGPLAKAVAVSTGYLLGYMWDGLVVTCEWLWMSPGMSSYYHIKEPDNLVIDTDCKSFPGQ